MRFKMVVTAVLCAALVAGLAAAARAQTTPSRTATFLAAIHSSGTKATLKVRYQCGTGKVLWISAKQSATGAVDKRLVKEGSSKRSASWLESHRNKVTCDGASHVATFALDTVEKGSKGKLVAGTAWVQFCVTAGQKLTLSKSAWVKVI